MIVTIKLYCFECMYQHDIFELRGEGTYSVNLEAYYHIQCTHCGNMTWRLDVTVKKEEPESIDTPTHS